MNHGYQASVRALTEWLLRALATMGGKDSVEALDMVSFYLEKASRDAETRLENKVLVHLARAAADVAKGNGEILETLRSALVDGPE